MAEPMPMGRFRPNIVAAGCAPFEEDTWRRIRIGDMVFRVVKGCSRCKITTTDQATGEQGSLVGADGAPEPLSALRAAGRGVGSEVYFGQNLVHEWPLPLLERAARWLRGQPQLPVVCAGDRIEVLERGPPVWDEEAVREAEWAEARAEASSAAEEEAAVKEGARFI
mmetsp:Transcript_41716/g.138741  ORF Transcript_41716/g.138741 Transcript_41716/m.138741 type:complete len:167 (+) Transcript_41716:805-1305(+)